jgi:ubiquitin-protein ligase
MLTELRWQKEQELMRSVFPEFRPFARGTSFGFEGYLKGARSGQVYGVTLAADQTTYPQAPPTVGMQPRIGIHWFGEGERRRLCMDREWRPARSTFANTLLALIRYIDEQDPRPGRGPEPEGPPAVAPGDPHGRFRAIANSWRGAGPY